jgi:Fe-S-cluster containining protein
MRRFSALVPMKKGKPFPIPVRAAKPRVQYSCLKCPGYCCSYPEIEVTPRDIERLAKHFDVSYAQAEEKFTKYDKKEKVRNLRHQKDEHFATVCVMFDRKARRCTVYEARPSVCRAYPDSPRCGYYDFLKFERAHQDDPDFIAVT